MKNMAVTVLNLVLVLTTAVFAGMFAIGCGGDTGQGGQANFDTGEPMKDVGHSTDTGADASVKPDTGEDAEVPVDVGVDSGVDAEVMADIGVDSGMDTDVEVYDDVGPDAGVDASVDASVPDGGEDAALFDAEVPDTGTDASSNDVGLPDVGEVDGGAPDAGCVEQCTDAICGADNGCGGQCVGSCVFINAVCNPQTYACVCQPVCVGKCGGDDGCGGACPDDCVLPATCGGGSVPNVCGCAPTCAGKFCGENDGCDTAVCTGCLNVGEICLPSVWVCCQPNCVGKTCGQNDGCGGLCTACANPLQYCDVQATWTCRDKCGLPCNTNAECQGWCGNAGYYCLGHECKNL